MPAVDFNLTSALEILTISDVGDDNIFGSCIERPANLAAINQMILLDAKVAKVNTYQELEFYTKTGGDPAKADWMMGSRVNTINDNFDAYWAGIRVAGASARLRIIKRVAGVISELAASAVLLSAANIPVATLFKLIFETKGSDLTVTLNDASDSEIDTLSVVNGDLSNSGTVALGSFDVSALAIMRMDNWEISEVV